MKKTAKIISLLLALVLVLCSCGKSGSFSDGLDENGFIKGVKATDYIEVGDVDKVVISQGDIDAEIEYLVTYAFPKEVPSYEGTITEEDNVNIDYVGSVDGVEFDGGNTKGEGTTVDIDQTSYIEGFLEQLVGHKPGDTFDINVTFPDPYDNNLELSGKDAVFKTTVNYIAKYEPNEWNDDFVLENIYSYFYYYYGLEIKTADEYIEYLKTSMSQNTVYGSCKLKEGQEIPEAVQSHVNSQIMLNLKEQAEKVSGVELSTYLKENYGVDSEEAFLEQYADDLKQEATTTLIIQALAEHYGITATEDDVKGMFTSEEEGAMTFDQAVKEYGLPYLKQYVTENLVWEHVAEITTVE